MLTDEPVALNQGIFLLVLVFSRIYQLVALGRFLSGGQRLTFDRSDSRPLLPPRATSIEVFTYQDFWVFVISEKIIKHL